MEWTRKKIIGICVFVVIAAISFFLIAPYASDAAHFGGTLAALDEKSETVLKLTGGATALSSAISFIPGDACTPVAENLADMGTYFLFILSALYLEKWLVTITGMLAFKIFIPICCLGLAVNVMLANDKLRTIMIKLICFALIIFALVPVSVVLSGMIDDSYQATMEQTIDKAKKNTQDIRDKTGDGEDENALKNFFNKVKGGVTGQLDELEDTVNSYVQSIAVLIVTSCVIRIATLIFFIWLIRMIMGLEFTMPRMRLPGRK